MVVVSAGILSRWIRYVQEREILEDTERQWEDKVGGKTNKSHISWQEYRSHVFGFIEEDKPEVGYNFRQGVVLLADFTFHSDSQAND